MVIKSYIYEAFIIKRDSYDITLNKKSEYKSTLSVWPKLYWIYSIHRKKKNKPKKKNAEMLVIIYTCQGWLPAVTNKLQSLWLNIKSLFFVMSQSSVGLEGDSSPRNYMRNEALSRTKFWYAFTRQVKEGGFRGMA